GEHLRTTSHPGPRCGGSTAAGETTGRWSWFRTHSAAQYGGRRTGGSVPAPPSWIVSRSGWWKTGELLGLRCRQDGHGTQAAPPDRHAGAGPDGADHLGPRAGPGRWAADPAVGAGRAAPRAADRLCRRGVRRTDGGDRHG